MAIVLRQLSSTLHWLACQAGSSGRRHFWRGGRPPTSWKHGATARRRDVPQRHRVLHAQPDEPVVETAHEDELRPCRLRKRATEGPGAREGRSLQGQGVPWPEPTSPRFRRQWPAPQASADNILATDLAFE